MNTPTRASPPTGANASTAKAVIITGGTRGLGWEMALALLEAGHRVIVTGAQGGDRLQRLQDQLQKFAKGPHALAVQADVTQFGACEQVANTCLTHFGRIDGLVNNAGRGMLEISDNFMAEPALFWKAAPEAFQTIIDTNVTGPFFMARACVPHMVAQGFGRVVNVSTSLGTMVRTGYSPYGPSKAGLEALSVVWAKDLAGTGVTVNVLLPGGASATDMLPANAPKDKLLPADIMRAPIAWLISEASSAFTGDRFSAKDWPTGVPAEQAALAARSPRHELPSIV